MSEFAIENWLHDAVVAPERHPTDQRFHDILAEMADLHDKKALDYGQDDDPFANVRASEEWGMPAWVGAMVRLTDKVRRLQAFADKGELANEGAIDSFNDIAVYAVIARVLYEQDQEKAENPLHYCCGKCGHQTDDIVDYDCHGDEWPCEPPTVAVKDDFYDSTLDLLDTNSEAHREWRKERGYIDTPCDVSCDGRARIFRNGEPICFDCDRPRSDAGVPAICAAWHEPAAHLCSECGTPIDGYCPSCGLEY